ncbi:GSU2403 family nucleotidyltransferase fold protein, partial [Rhizobiaceae sp. 2RAB30]
RYAVHKLIVATRRRTDGISAVKRDKDIRQAEILFEALYETRRASDFALAYDEAEERGPAWRDALQEGEDMLSRDGRKVLSQILRQGNQQIGKGRSDDP